MPGSWAAAARQSQSQLPSHPGKEYNLHGAYRGRVVARAARVATGGLCRAETTPTAAVLHACTIAAYCVKPYSRHRV